MIEMQGIYQNGHIELDGKIITPQPVKVNVTFLENIESEEKKPLSFSGFSFIKSRRLLQNYKGSFSEEVIKERRERIPRLSFTEVSRRLILVFKFII